MMATSRKHCTRNDEHKAHACYCEHWKRVCVCFGMPEVRTVNIDCITTPFCTEKHE